MIEVVESQRRSAEPRGISAVLDAFETPLAIARLDGAIELANAAFRSWTASTASDLAAVFEAPLADIVAALRTGKPHIIKASAKNARGRGIPVEYQLALIERDGSELIAIEGRDQSSRPRPTTRRAARSATAGPRSRTGSAHSSRSTPT